MCTFYFFCDTHDVSKIESRHDDDQMTVCKYLIISVDIFLDGKRLQGGKVPFLRAGKAARIAFRRVEIAILDQFREVLRRWQHLLIIGRKIGQEK